MQIDYSMIRHKLTEAIRQLEVFSSTLTRSSLVYKYCQTEIDFCSEVDYWITSLELARTALYGCTKEYEGDFDLQFCIDEIKNEMSNTYTLMFSKLTDAQQKQLKNVWLDCEKLGGLLTNV